MSNPITGTFALLRAVYILVREGVFSALPAEGLPPMAALAHRLAGLMARRSARRAARSERLSQALNRLGPSYVKLGQFLATRPDIVGTEIAVELSQLQDKVPPFPREQAIRDIEVTLGRRIDDLFVEFGDVVGAASIAQVHKARVLTRDGAYRDVAVKVIRPGVRVRFRRELEAFAFIARVLETFVRSSRRLRPIAVVETLAQSTRIEMDLRLEAAASSEMADNVANDPHFRVPGIDWERTGRDVLTMEWIDGIKMNDVAAVRAAGHDLPRLGVDLVQSFLRHSMRDGFFHADMHPGNLFVVPDGTIVAVDLGIVGRLTADSRRFLAEILYGFIRRDYQRVAEVHFEAGYVPRTQDVLSFAQALRAIGEPIHGQPAETISMAHLLTLLFEVTELFDMQTRPELVLLQKTMVVVEGVARSYDPRFNMWEAAEPVVTDYIVSELGPAAKLRDAKKGLEAIGRVIHRFPDFAAGLEVFANNMPDLIENGIHINDDDLMELAKESRTGLIISHIAQVASAIALVVIAWQLTFG
ncbi:2-polyprenylphenol 6-hydroxylase [Aureimonas phyllosphaerae]|uniref:Ubiquinone biosynthesis protein n=1 Tax=Aureimonas phyllosphaerae TaxID=1166078 RepID=A0A7W6C304_9HYPH|nr:2-polyprenylphenol 6-hydroxylase [Aureimonas phyllosphaerae]MBB3937512.1 ubiquinone biosynthesis protein [Aureimonas phyllosphaerae]MBB3961422.1 ubiquinone biosynthesis protein [Aureimonas phyllosphaerae]SFF37977.1 2-octaprenylphenol hydroxylase [Aureimonas phyllosphaerae]